MGLQLKVVNVIAGDMGRTLEFYRRLGVDVTEAAEGKEHVEVTMDGGFTLAWDAVGMQRRVVDPGWGGSRGGQISVEFWLRSPKEVDAKYAEMTALGYRGRAAPFDAPWGFRYCLLEDPDGNAVALGAEPGG